ncbi:PREDICTED: F-box/kelch-repeat protein SKIP25 [Theobroma cacao]|uniref:F-box/kelch-repeat protein SKIP25 n=1 Tax=Theobroma cacao TaxID=3641 RepID=A0AB32VD87_THECC|nr:PREDICTED: F-box/kelch-repeat protein SKIP25 [Theobroma cacao]
MGKSHHPRKRHKLVAHHQDRQEQPLIPGLPDHVAELCLSRLHPSLLYSICRSWRRFIYSPLFLPFPSLYTLFSSSNNEIQLLSFDPMTSKWEPVPPPPSPLRLLVHHPSFISRNLPVQSISVSGNLVLLAATAPNFNPALSRPLIFSPLSRSWRLGPPMATPRRWCAVGASGPTIYVASGIGFHFSTDVARSLERWDLEDDEMNGARWKKMRQLKDSRFSRDAIDAVGWRRKLCMVNVAKQGSVYDVENDRWEDMPEGMVAGWRGPVAAMDEEVLYAVDEVKGVLTRYDQDTTDWEEIMESERLIGARQMAAAAGRLCVVCGNGEILVVDVVVVPPRFWVVESPPALEPLAVHVLPRMSRADFS